MEDAYRVEKRVNTGGHAVAYTVDRDGRERLATEAEIWIWEALQVARAATTAAKKGK
jgi:predicted ABC-type ATPase